MWVFPDTGFSWSRTNTNQAPYIKFFRFHKRTSSGANNGYNSLMMQENKSPWISLENTTQPNVFQSSPRTTLENGSWQYLEAYFKMSTDPAVGNVKIWLDGSLILDNNVQTMDSNASQVDFSYLFSAWNGKPPQSQSLWIDDLYISTEARSTVFQGGTPPDSVAPTLENLDPADGQTGVSTTKDPFFEFGLSDGESGIDTNTIRLTLEGNNETDDLIIGGNLSSTSVLLSLSNVDATITNDLTVNWDINASDLAGNELTTQSGTFTTAPSAVSSIFGTGDAGDRNNYTERTATRWQTIDESGDILYQINTTTFDQTGGGALGELSFFNLQTYKDFRFEAQARSDENLATNSFADFCIVFGYEDANNYYYAIYNSDSASTEIFRVINGDRTTVASYVGSVITDNVFHSVFLEYQNKTLVMKHNGTTLLTVVNQNVPEGNVGIGGYNDKSTWDDIVITDLGVSDPGTPPPSDDQTVVVTIETGSTKLKWSSDNGEVKLKMS